MPFLGLRNPGISHYGDKYPLPFINHTVKSDCLQLSLTGISYVLYIWNFNLYLC